MKILILELYLFKRLSLNGTEFIRITPNEPIQLILGTNGSGKSSLIQELTPLPANSNDFLKEGYKSITIEHHGSTYILKSTFSGPQKHSFLKDNEELNPGNTLTVQRDLVKQEFNITPDIHQLMTAQSGFHAMSPIDRRHWFTRLSDVNYDYAISIYLKLKDKSRDVTGALKLAKKRLVSETSKAISQEEQTQLQEQVDELHKFIQHLLELRIPVEEDISTLKYNTTSLEANISKFSNILLKKRTGLSNTNRSVEDIVEEINQSQSLLSVEKILLDKYILDFNKLDETVKALRVTEHNDIETLLIESKLKKNSLDILFNSLKLKLNIESAINSSRAFETVYDTLNTVFTTLPINEDRKYSYQKLNELSEFILNYKGMINGLTSDLNKLSVQKEHQEHKRDNEKIECPACNHIWSKGYDENFYNSICTKIEVIQSNLDEAVIVLLEKETYLEEIKDYSVIYRDYTNTVNNWPILKPLWDYIIESNDIFNNPRKILKVLELFKYDLSIFLKIDNERLEIDRINNLIMLAERTGNESIEQINLKLIEVEEFINSSTDKSRLYNQNISKLTNHKKDIELILDLQSKIENLIADHDKIIKDTHETYRRLAFNDLVRTVQSNLSRKELILSEVKIQKAIIQDLESQIETMEMDSEAYKLLVKELSPTDGLIAQGLLGFIKSFVKQMNGLIKKIWSYQLQIIPCGISDGISVELDYKFPLLVQDKENIVSDVSKGSAAMKEVIDLAFKLTSMKYLGLSDAPIYLDEFAATMDSAHRILALETIKNLMDVTSFSQLFMISHYEASYGSLVNAEICVLCKNNIVIPKDSIFNKHVILS